MKKQFLSFVVLGMSLFSLSASAQHHHGAMHQRAQQPATECCVKPECTNNNGACSPAECCPGFEGLNLTAEQQAKLKALREKSGAQRQEKAKAGKEARKDRRAQSDSVRRADQRDYLNGVKEILTPEQYVQFLENMVVNGRPGHGRPNPHEMRQSPRRQGPRHDGAVQQKKIKRSDNSVVISGSGKKAEKAVKTEK